MKQRRVMFIVALLCTLVPSAAFAVGLPIIVPPECNQLGGCQSICDIAQLATNLLNVGIYAAIFLSAVLFAWAGGKLIIASSAGDSHGVSDAKAIFRNVIIGLIIMLSSWLIVNVIMYALTGKNTWNNICVSAQIAAPHHLATVDR